MVKIWFACNNLFNNEYFYVILSLENEKHFISHYLLYAECKKKKKERILYTYSRLLFHNKFNLSLTKDQTIKN